MSLTDVFVYTLIAAVIITGGSHLIKKQKNLIIALLKNFLGAFLIFSGFVKAVDPLGTAYKMHDYFVAFGGFFTKLDPIALPLAIGMVVLELVLGLALILGAHKKLALYTTGLLIIAFTFLTGYTYLNGFVNPDYYNKEVVAEKKANNEKVPFIVAFDENNMKVTDCGCFGDFLKIKPKYSFFKDIFLLLLIGVLIAYANSITPILDRSGLFWIIVGGFGLISLLFCFSNYITNLPIADFRPYKIGNNIPQQMIPEIEDSVEYLFIYKNLETNEQQEFPITNIPKSGWKFVDRKENVIVEGKPAKIANFLVLDEDGADRNADLLEDENFNFWVVAYELGNTKKEAFNKVNEVAEKAQEAGYMVFGLASDANDEYRHQLQTAFPFYIGDETFFKTIIRSNPGLVLVKNGTIIDKWHHRHIPTFEEIESKYLK